MLQQQRPWSISPTAFYTTFLNKKLLIFLFFAFSQKSLAFFRIRSYIHAWTPLLLDMELLGIFWKSQTIRDIKNSIKYHQNIFKIRDQLFSLSMVKKTILRLTLSMILDELFDISVSLRFPKNPNEFHV